MRLNKKTPAESANFAEVLEENLHYSDSDCTYSEELAAAGSLVSDAAGRDAFLAFCAISDSTNPGRALFFLPGNGIHLESNEPGVAWCSLQFSPGETFAFDLPAGVSISSLYRLTCRSGFVCDECLGHAVRYAEAFTAASAESLLADLDVAALRELVNS